MRKLARSIIALVLSVPLTAWGLGLGDIKLHSALNQPMDADIELLSAEPDIIDHLTIELASYETFTKLGVDRPAYLMFLRFALEQKADGTYFVKVTSKKPIREPFIDFVLEVNWRSGRLLREYTVLLDPPQMTKATQPQVTAPSAQAAAPAPAAQQAETAASAPARLPGTSYVAPSAPMAADGELVYGPVKADDTLWGIARKMRADSSVSINQVMMALYNSNQDAFINGNINRLKKGQVLRIDDPAQVTAMSKAEAYQAVMRHQQRWVDYKQTAAEKAGRTTPGKAPVSAAGVAAPAEDARLKLVSPKGDADKTSSQEGTGRAEKAQLEEELMLAMESAEAQSRQNEELRNRLTEMEEQVAAMERLLELKDDDLAALQSQLRAQAAGEKVEPQPLKSEMAEPEPMAESAEKTAKPAMKEMAEPAAKPEMTAEQAAKTEKPVKKPVPKKPAMVKPAPKPQPSFMDQLLSDPLYMAGGGAVIVVLLALLMVVIRRRRQGSGFQESILTGGTSSMLKGSSEEGISSETSFLSDLASGMGDKLQEEGEVDPLTEADVYMAYGRNQQAEELLKEAIQNQPDRLELTMKLLELYHSTKNSDSFSALAADSKIAMQKDESMWNKVLVMGHEICPDDPLFSAAAEIAGKLGEAETDVAEGMSDEVLDIGLDLDAFAAEMEGESEESKQEEDEFHVDLGVDLGDIEEEMPTAEAAVEEEPQEEELDLSALEQDLSLGEETAAEEKPAEEEAAGMDFDIDFELPSEGAEEAPAEVKTEEKTEEAGGMDFDMGDFALPESEEPAEESASEEAGLDLGDLDLGSLDIENAEPATDSEGEEMLDMDMGELDLGDEGAISGQDEIATKLDLAKAYIEMEDKDGAREMLNEVVKEGSAEQKQEAESLLQQIG